MSDRRVLKYELQPGRTSLVLPAGSRVLSVGYQRGAVVMWVLALVDKAPSSEHHFLAVGTGHPYDSEAFGPFIGTVRFPEDEGGLVFHVFETNG
jgi:hypothetical protein